MTFLAKHPVLARLCLAGLSLAGFARADVVELVDGSRLVGEARALEGGKLTFSTTFAGDLELNWLQVKTLETNVPALKALKPATPPAATDEPEQRVWHYDVAFDLAGKTGNTESIRHGLNLAARLNGPLDELKLYLANEWAETEGDKTEDRLTLGVDYERAIGDTRDNAWYVRSEYQRDKIKDIDYRWTTATGFGRYFFREPTHSLRGRAGLFYTHEKYADPPFGSTAEPRGKEDNLGLDLGLDHVVEVRDWLKVVTTITYMPEFGNIKDFRARHETTVDVPIAGSTLWTLRLGVANEYNSQPANHNQRLDTAYFVRLVLAWQHGTFLKSSGLLGE